MLLLRLLPFFLIPIVVFGFESEIGTFGYGRIQTTFDKDKSDVCFGVPGASSKYRLGNECETWVELGLTQDIVFDNGIKMHNQVRPIFYAPNNEKIDFFDWGEAYSEISNIIDNSMSIWIGRRFYKRWESHMNDYWPLNMSGDGFGINNLDLGSLQLSYAFIFENLNPTIDLSDQSSLFASHDLRFVKEFDQGELTFFANYMHLQSKTFDATHHLDAQKGYTLAVLYKDNTITENIFDMKGESVTGLFYGSGLSKDTGEYVPYMQKQFERESLIDNLINSGTNIENSKTYRAINYNTFENDNIGFMTNLIYEYRDEEKFSGIKQNWFSAGLRPYWFFYTNARLVAELGYDRVNNKIDNEKYELYKSTIATEFAFDKGIWERPVLRLYYTNANWSKDAQGKIGGKYYANDTSGDVFGIQLETWW
ncbi:MAG: carbohydrate porin [Campylobacterota bacterium]|nr:carbohydrate porin [Campylobacterota bacterium]